MSGTALLLVADVLSSIDASVLFGNPFSERHNFMKFAHFLASISVVVVYSLGFNETIGRYSGAVYLLLLLLRMMCSMVHSSIKRLLEVCYLSLALQILMAIPSTSIQ